MRIRTLLDRQHVLAMDYQECPLPIGCDCGSLVHGHSSVPVVVASPARWCHDVDFVVESDRAMQHLEDDTLRADEGELCDDLRIGRADYP